MSSMFRPLALALSLTAGVAAAQDVPRTLTVQGSAEVQAVPDMAHISVGVVAEHESAAAATEQMAEGARAILDRLLTEEQIDSADVQTGQLSLNPRVVHDGNGEPPRTVGYVASTSVDVTLRDLSRLGGLLDTLVADGANTLGGLQFDLSGRDAAMDQALELAIQDAMDRAKLMAGAAGVTLGPVLTMNEGGVSAPQSMVGYGMERMAAVSIAPGELEVGASVTMTFAISDQ